MNKKYFETKSGSLEEISTKIATEQPSITKQEPNVKLERKTYFENKPGSLEDIAAKVVSEGKELKEEVIKENPLMALGRTASAAAGAAAGTTAVNRAADAIGASVDPKAKKETKKSFEKLRTETKLVRLGEKGKTATGKKAAVVDLEPRANPV